jgi:hypothetical protein
VIEDNLRKVPGEVKHPVKNVSSVFKDEKENILGGIIGTIFCYYQHIDFLWVDETLRGNGYRKKLLRSIEESP